MFRSIGKGLVALSLVFASSYLLEITLHQKGVPGRDLLFGSSLLVGLVAGALVYLLSMRERQREAFVECRLRVIADMNHHIRNALQVITFYSRSGNKKEVGIVEAVERIQWALREVLPQLPDFAEQDTLDAQQLGERTVAIQDNKKTERLFRAAPLMFPRQH